MVTYIAVSAEEVWYELFVHIVNEAPIPLVVFATVDEELVPGVVIYKGAHESPQYWEHPEVENVTC